MSKTYRVVGQQMAGPDVDLAKDLTLEQALDLMNHPERLPPGGYAAISIVADNFTPNQYAMRVPAAEYKAGEDLEKGDAVVVDDQGRVWRVPRKASSSP